MIKMMVVTVIMVTTLWIIIALHALLNPYSVFLRIALFQPHHLTDEETEALRG